MKKVYSLIAMTLCMFFASAMPLAAAELNDVQGHWAENSILRWAETTVTNADGEETTILNGMGNGKFEPNTPTNRAGLSKMLTALFGFTEAADPSGFSDMTDEGAWYHHAMLACAEAGILVGIEDENGDLCLEPQGELSREQAFTMISRAFKLYLSEADTPATARAAMEQQFSDHNAIGHWALGHVAALWEAGAVIGYGDGTLDPDGTITRAEVAKIIDCLALFYVDAKGEYSLSTFMGADGVTAGHVAVVHRFSPLEVTLKLNNGALVAEMEVESTSSDDAAATETTTENPLVVENGLTPIVVVGDQWRAVAEDAPVTVDDADIDQGEYANII